MNKMKTKTHQATNSFASLWIFWTEPIVVVLNPQFQAYISASQDRVSPSTSYTPSRHKRSYEEDEDMDLHPSKQKEQHLGKNLRWWMVLMIAFQNGQTFHFPTLKSLQLFGSVLLLQPSWLGGFIEVLSGLNWSAVDELMLLHGIVWLVDITFYSQFLKWIFAWQLLGIAFCRWQHTNIYL